MICSYIPTCIIIQRRIKSSNDVVNNATHQMIMFHHIHDFLRMECYNGCREEEFPNILFAPDGDIYTIEGMSYLVIGGAHSVDKHYRLSRRYAWWADEQPSDETKTYVEKQIAEKHFDVILSHTCPYKYELREMFLPMIDQSTVDASTELWLDTIEESVDYRAWLCGHWHTDKRIDKMHFLFHEFESAHQF